MNDKLIIARQANELYELSDRVEKLEERISDAKKHMVCIGGPLNDNRLQFTHEQLQIFQKIMLELEDD